MSYKLKNINPRDLARNLGLSYNTFVNYRVTDPEYPERVDFVENYLYGNAEPSYLKSRLTGRPLLSRYVILDYTDADGNESSSLLESIFINVNQAKEIKKTIIKGIDGTFKEFINSGDYTINMSGAIIGSDPWNFDNDEVNNFIQLCNTPDVININNSYLNDLFSITNIVIDSWELNQSTDYSNVVYFKIEASSDFDQNQIIQNE